MLLVLERRSDSESSLQVPFVQPHHHRHRRFRILPNCREPDIRQVPDDLLVRGCERELREQETEDNF